MKKWSAANNKLELQRLYLRDLNHILGEMESRFHERNTALTTVLKALHPEGETFLDATATEPIIDLTNATVVESEYIVAKQYISKLKNSNSQEKWTVRRLLLEQHKILNTMPSVFLAFKLFVTFGVSTAMWENLFSTNILSDRRCAQMLHSRKSQCFWAWSPSKISKWMERCCDEEILHSESLTLMAS